MNEIEIHIDCLDIGWVVRGHNIYRDINKYCKDEEELLNTIKNLL